MENQILFCKFVTINMINIELNSIFNDKFTIEFRYIFQHKENGKLKVELFSFDDLQSGLLHILLQSDEFVEYNILGSDIWTGLYDRKHKKIYVNDILRHRNVRKYSNVAPENQEFLVTYGMKVTNTNQIASSGFIFKPIGLLETNYTMFNTKYDTDIVANIWTSDIKYTKENYTIKL